MRGPDGVDRAGYRLRPVPLRGARRVDFPAVGRLGDARRRTRRRTRSRDAPLSSPPCSPAGPRSSAVRPTRAGGRRASSPTSRSSPPTSTSRSSSPGSITTSTCADSSATSPSRGRAASRPVVVLNKADVADDLDQRLLDVEAIAPAVPIVVLSALTGDHVADLRRPPRARARPRSCSARRASASRRSSTRSSASSARRPRRSARTTRGAATRRPTGSCSSCRAARCLIDTPGIRALEVAGADDGVEVAFDDIAELAAACRFSDCRHEASPAARSAPPSTTGG